MNKLIAWGNPILFAFLSGAAAFRLFDFISSGRWQLIDVLTMAFFLAFGLFWSIAFQRHLAVQHAKG